MIWKSPETVIRNALISDADFTSLAGHRVYANIAPADAALPFAIWRRSSVRREQTLSQPLGVPTVRLDLQIYAETYITARKAADAARGVLDGFRGSFDNTQVSLCSLDSESDGIAALDGSEVPNAYLVTQEYDILWQES
jgi:hypothetical protein